MEGKTSLRLADRMKLNNINTDIDNKTQAA